ncbi:hypothetical protein A0J48_026425, partial [Sphaerospermopsis aphanizomenoides BCCUSP55]|uniref:hypothetical protein n=1 Tax=Sphaerospermopsis aphanizomenoides TaxID=459663 RepID=UPI001904457D
MTSFEKTAAMLNNMIPDLEKGLTKGQRVFRQTKRLAQGLTDVTQRFKFFSEEFSKAKATQKALEKLSKEFEEVKKVQDKVLEKVPGKGNAQKAVAASGVLASLALSAASTGISLGNLFMQNLIQHYNEKAGDRIQNDLFKIYSTIQLQKSRIDTANGQIYELKQQDQRNRDRIYKVEKDVPVVRAMANDALYEVRAGRQILENKIADNQKQTEAARKLGNDALYEVRAGRGILEQQIAGMQGFAKNLLNNSKAEFQKAIDAALNGISKQLDTANKNADKASKDVAIANNQISEVNRIIAQIRAEIGGIKPGEPINLDRIKADIIARLTPEMQAYLRSITPGNLINFNIDPSRYANAYDMNALKKQQDARWVQTLNELASNNKILQDLLTYRDYYSNLFKLQAEAAQGSRKAAEEVSRLNKQQIDAFWRDINAKNAGTQAEISQVKIDMRTEVEKLNERLNDSDKNNEKKITPLIQQVSKNEIGKGLEPIKADLTDIKNDLNQKTIDIRKIDQQLKERQGVDERVERKINSIIPTIAGIPLIVGRVPSQTTNLITPKIPTTTQIGNVVKDSVCNTKCQIPSITTINNVGNGIKDDLGQKIRDGNSALQSGALAEILRRLGDFIPGGISGKLVNGFKWLQLDRALNILTFAATIHNAAMLSNDIIQTLIGALTNVLTLILPKDDSGKAFSINEVLNSTVENLVKGIIGTENYTTLSNAWAKANRIYQATTNVLTSFMGLTQTVLQAAEMIAAYTGQIGNALKKGGVILENAYGWMNPQPKFNRVTQTLENLQQAASTVQMVTQVPLDVISQTT